MIDIQKLAEQAEIDIDTDGDIWGSTNGSLARFAGLVLEEAAKVCDMRRHAGEIGAAICADAIRAMKPGKPS